MIQVTAAIIHKNNKFLICQRPKGKHCELLWEFPGGKIEKGEAPEECLVRECHEELNIIICPQKLIGIVDNISVNIHFYICKLIEGEPVCIEHNDIRWLTMNEILKLPLCPADSKLLNNIIDKKCL